MSPSTAYEYVKSSRPRVLLAAAQRQAVQDYYHRRVKTGKPSYFDKEVVKASILESAQNPLAFDRSSVVMVTKSDLEGYDGSKKSGIVGNDIWAELSWVYRVQFAGQATLVGVSCPWFQCLARQDVAV